MTRLYVMSIDEHSSPRNQKSLRIDENMGIIVSFTDGTQTLVQKVIPKVLVKFIVS